MPSRQAAPSRRQARLRTQESTFYQAWVLINLTARPFAALFGRRFHLNLNDWRIMLTVADHPGITAQALADYSGLDKMSVSRGVRNLEVQGRLARDGNEADRRLRHLSLTAEGWAVYSEIARSAARREAQLYRALSADELRDFHRLLMKLTAHARELKFEDR
jgi:DNA-binding MarR family transcriptional regulator